MAVPTVVGTGAASAGTGDITPALPAGIQADDILVLFVESAYGEAVSAPSGWEAAPNSPIESSSGGTRLSVFWKRAGGSESAPTVTDPGDHVIGAIIAFRGVVADKFPFLNTKSGTTAASSSKTILAARTQGIKDVLCVGAISSGADGKTTAQFSSSSGTSLTSITERIDAFTDLGNGGGLGVFTATRSSAYYAPAGDTPGWSVTDSSTTSQGAYWSCGLVPSDAPSVYLRGAGDRANGTAAITLAMPDGVRENDILIAFLETANQDITITGWTEAGSSPASNTSGNATRATVFWKRAGTSESSVTTSDSGLHQEGFVIAVAGAPTTGDPFQVTGNTTSGSGQSVTIGGITTTSSNTLVLVAVASTGVAGYSSWANSNLTDVTASYASGYSNGVSLFGAIGLMHGYKAAAGATGNTTVTLSGSGTSGSWAGWTGAIGTAGQTLSAEPGTLTVSSQNAQFNWLFADAGTLSMAGEAANINQSVLLSADVGTLSVASGDANLNFGYALKADSSNLTATPYEARILYDIKLQAQPGAIQLFGGTTSVYAPSPAISTLNFLIDVAPSFSSSAYQQYTERMTVDGTDVAVRSWSYNEQANAVGGSLNVELADVSQRSLFDGDPQIVFEVGRWNGSAWEWTSLLDTGALRNSQYVIGSNGSSPNDAFTIVAMSETEDRLNTAPDKNVVWYDPNQDSLTEAEIPTVDDINGVRTAGELVSIPSMTLHDVMQRLFVTECGFSGYRTNIQNFPLKRIEFTAGQPYASALAGVIGMYEPTYTTIRNGGSLVICVNDGTIAPVPGVTAGRTVDVSTSRFMGLARDTSDNGMANVGAIEVAVNDNPAVFQYINRRQETSTSITGNFGPDSGEYLERETTNHYIDFYDSRYGDEPYRSQLDRVEVDTYRNGKLTGTLIEQSNEEFVWQYGNLTERYKSTKTLVPYFQHPVIGQEPYTYTDENGQTVTTYINIIGTGWEYAGMTLQLTSEEFEEISRKMHPYNYGTVYIDKRTTVFYGLVYIDTENQQLDEDYVRDAVTVYRAGNVTGNMTPDYRKTKLVQEVFEPSRDGTVGVRKTEFDYLSDVLSFEDYKQDDGQVGKNAFVGNQKRIVVYPPGETAITGTVMRMNAGELPIDRAVALGKRKLALAQASKKQFEFELIGADPTLQRGSLIAATGRDGASLGTFVVNAVTMSGTTSGYFTRVQARSV